MDKRTAKREACWRSAQLIRSAMAESWPSEQYNAEEYGQVSAALLDVIAELERRGHL